MRNQPPGKNASAVAFSLPMSVRSVWARRDARTAERDVGAADPDLADLAGRQVFAAVQIDDAQVVDQRREAGRLKCQSDIARSGAQSGVACSPRLHGRRKRCASQLEKKCGEAHELVSVRPSAHVRSADEAS